MMTHLWAPVLQVLTPSNISRRLSLDKPIKNRLVTPLSVGNLMLAWSATLRISFTTCRGSSTCSITCQQRQKLKLQSRKGNCWASAMTSGRLGRPVWVRKAMSIFMSPQLSLPQPRFRVGFCENSVASGFSARSHETFPDLASRSYVLFSGECKYCKFVEGKG